MLNILIPTTWDGVTCRCYLRTLKPPTQLPYHPTSRVSRLLLDTRVRIWHAIPPQSLWIPTRPRVILRGNTLLVVVLTVHPPHLQGLDRRINEKILKLKFAVSGKRSRIWRPSLQPPLSLPLPPTFLQLFVNLGSGEPKPEKKCIVLSIVPAMHSVPGMIRDESVENTLPETHLLEY